MVSAMISSPIVSWVRALCLMKGTTTFFWYTSSGSEAIVSLNTRTQANTADVCSASSRVGIRMSAADTQT